MNAYAEAPAIEALVTNLKLFHFGRVVWAAFYLRDGRLKSPLA